MVTRLLRQKDVRKKFNEIFKKPPLLKNLLTEYPIDYNASLLGNALDYYISCQFNYLKRNDTDTLREKIQFWIEELNKETIHKTNKIENKPSRLITERTVACQYIFSNKNQLIDFRNKTKEMSDKIEKLYKSINKKKVESIVVKQRSICFKFKFANNTLTKDFSSKTQNIFQEMGEIYVLIAIGNNLKKDNKNLDNKIVERYFTCFKYKNNLIKYGIQDDSARSTEIEKVLGREIVYSYSTSSVVKLLEGSLKQYNEYQHTGKITQKFIASILILAQILPGIQFFSLGKNLGKPTKMDCKMLFHLIKQIPKDFYKAKSVFINPYLKFGLISGEPDYIIDDLILDIKTTERFFSKSDYNQLICYYLLYLLDLGYWNKRQVKINKIGMYYALYGQIIQFNVSDLCTSSQLKEIVQLIKSKSTVQC